MKIKQSTEKKIATIFIGIVATFLVCYFGWNIMLSPMIEAYKEYGFLGAGIAFVLSMLFFIFYFYMIKAINWAINKISE